MTTTTIKKGNTTIAAIEIKKAAITTFKIETMATTAIEENMMAQSNSSRLGFPALITALCRSTRVGSDALTSYENLRPAIDLAYIIRKCWNVNDQI